MRLQDYSRCERVFHLIISPTSLRAAAAAAHLLYADESAVLHDSGRGSFLLYVWSLFVKPKVDNKEFYSII